MFRRRPSPLIALAVVLAATGLTGGVRVVLHHATRSVSAAGQQPVVDTVALPEASRAPAPSVAPTTASPSPKPRPAPSPSRRVVPKVTPEAPAGPAVLRGLSAWIDVYDYKSDTPVATAVGLIDAAQRGGATTVWIEPSRYNTADLWAPTQLGAMLDRAAELGLPVVLWTLPGFADVEHDIHQAEVAAAFQGPRGGRASAIALDIEVSENAEPAVRSARLVQETTRLKGSLPVPLIAITPNPVGMARVPNYWPGFPWREMARDTIAIVPMGYWTFRDADPATYTRDVVLGIRRLTGRSDVPIHPIGGLAEETTAAGYRAFCRTAHELGVVGAGIYDLRTTQSYGWDNLSGCRSLGS